MICVTIALEPLDEYSLSGHSVVFPVAHAAATCCVEEQCFVDGVSENLRVRTSETIEMFGTEEN